LDEKLLPHHSPIQHEKGRKQDMNELMSKMVLEQSQMQLLGFKNAGNGVSPLRNESGIAAAIKWDSTGVLAYETVIPFKTFYKDNLTSSSISKIWTICFVLNGIEQVSDKKDSGDNAGNGGGRGGGGMGGGGGMRGGGGGMRGGGDTTNQRYNLILSLNARNLFNTVNLSNPVSSLSSPNFGQSLSVAGGGFGGSSANNRRIDMSIRFSF
jgi:hypothetical protein